MAQQTPTAVSVSSAGLHLNSPRDSEIMLQRLHDAALEACGASVFSVPDYKWAVERSRCFKSSLDRAVAELDAPPVTRLDNGRGALAAN